MKNYKLTLTACYIGYVIQSIVNNLSPLLFARFSSQFGISEIQLTSLVFINFAIQILVDCSSAFIAMKLGYRKSTLIAQGFSALGLISLGVLPFVMPPFAGILVATALMAVGGGFVEVVLSPLIEALPLKNKSGAMCFLHSFYCWGHIFVVLAATLFFNTVGIDRWYILPVILAVLPVLNSVLFAKCPIETLEGDADPMMYKHIFGMKGFMLFIILMIASGAAEQAIAQWASYFAEISLNVSKTAGDLLGACLFALGMAIARTVYGMLGDKMNLKAFIIGSSALLTGAYLLASLAPSPYVALAGIAAGGLFVGIMWPGVYSLAGREYKVGGTKMFGLLALAGDVGCTVGPTLSGAVSSDIRTGLLVSTVFPVVLLVGTIALSLLLKKSHQQAKATL